MITFGGYDEKNIALKIISFLKKKDFKINAKIILGSTNHSLSKNFVKNHSRIKIVNKSKNMAKEISEATFGLCSGGMTTYEFACLGTPFAILSQNNHQLKTARNWMKKNVAVNLGKFDSITNKKLEQFFENYLSNSKLQNGRKFVDGKGSTRVNKEISSLLNS